MPLSFTNPATLGDWLSIAVAQFEAAGLSYGHGTSNALDEAAFLILRTLGLPIDALEREHGKRLSANQCDAVKTVIEKRIATKKCRRIAVS